MRPVCEEHDHKYEPGPWRVCKRCGGESPLIALLRKSPPEGEATFGATKAIPLLANLMQMHRERLPLWTVYNHPTDHPNYFVARMFMTLPEAEATPVCLLSDALEPIQAQLAALGLTKLMRHPNDDPKIMETWL